MEATIPEVDPPNAVQKTTTSKYSSATTEVEKKPRNSERIRLETAIAPTARRIWYSVLVKRLTIFIPCTLPSGLIVMREEKSQPGKLKSTPILLYKIGVLR